MAVTIDATFPQGDADATGFSANWTWDAFTTPGTNRMLVAVFEGDGTSARTIATFTSPNLTWTKRVSQIDAVTSHIVEIWTAFAASVVTGEVITQTDTSGASYNRRYFVIYSLAGSNAAGIGNNAVVSDTDGGFPSVTVTGTTAGSLTVGGIFYRSTAGGDITVDANTTAGYDGGSGGAFGFNGKTYSRVSASGGSLTLGFSASGGDTLWHEMAALEILEASAGETITIDKWSPMVRAQRRSRAQMVPSGMTPPNRVS